MTSLLMKSALDKLPNEIRDHIQVVDETGYAITVAMTIGDFKRLVGHFELMEDLRREAESARDWKRDWEAAVDDLGDAEAEVERLEKMLDAFVDAVEDLLSDDFDGDHSRLAAVLEAAR